MSSSTDVHTLDAGSVSSTFDAALPATLTVDPGTRVRVRTRSILSHVDTRSPDVFRAIGDYDHMDIPVTGPVEIRGARPGDVLRIDIEDIEIAEHGAMVTIPERGGFSERLDRAGLLLDIVDDRVLFDDLALPTKPMIGKIGVAHPDAPHCSTVGRHGGNMDCTQLGAGTTLYLPVVVPGAKLFLGDLHARQGDGEASLTGVEVEGAVTMTCRIVRGWPLRRPLLVTPHDTIAIGDGDDLDEAVRVCLDDMLELVLATRDWSREQAAMFLSAAADVAVCQIVNARKGARVAVPRSILPLPLPHETNFPHKTKE